MEGLLDIEIYKEHESHPVPNVIPPLQTPMKEKGKRAMATSSQDTFTAGIAGLSGKFARLVASHLLSRPHVHIRGLVRSAKKLPSSLSTSPRVTVIEGDAFDAASAQSLVRGCDVVICSYLGADALMIDGQKLLIDACAAEGVPRYLASDFTLDFTKLQKGQLFPKDPMIEVKEYLDAKKEVQGVHVLIAAFTDTFFSAYFQVWDGKERKLRTWGKPERVWEVTSYMNAAEYTAAVALDPKAVGVQRCELSYVALQFYKENG